MKASEKIKENSFLIAVAAAYVVLFFIRPELGLSSVRNSGYYIREMLLIMPVIFVLTGLLDVWIPKEKIMKYLGGNAGFKGILLSFVLGSISAGPIYAAFPLCVMLHKKGASIRNLVIILSSWAVIKVPMLLNETKFLGFRFMAIRWVLTVISILIFSWITALLVKEEDLPLPEQPEHGIQINGKACIGCALCTKIYPELFEIRNKKASLRVPNGAADREKLLRAVHACPANAITPSESDATADA